MNTQKNLAGMLGLVVALAAMASADVYTGNMVANPFMTGPDYTDWAATAPWRNNGGSANQVHDFKTDGTAGFASTFAATRDLTADAAITADPLYSASTTKLTDISFGNTWSIIPTWNIGNVGANMSANYYCEADIFTVGGDQYRVNSNTFVVDDTFMGGVGGGEARTWTTAGWASYGNWDGDAFASGGIALDQIASIDYKWVMQTVTANTDGGGTVFFQADNANLQYEVTTIPEPATLGMVAAVGGGLLWIRRKLTI